MGRGGCSAWVVGIAGLMPVKRSRMKAHMNMVFTYCYGSHLICSETFLSFFILVKTDGESVYKAAQGWTLSSTFFLPFSPNSCPGCPAPPLCFVTQLRHAVAPQLPVYASARTNRESIIYHSQGPQAATAHSHTHTQTQADIFTALSSHGSKRGFTLELV